MRVSAIHEAQASIHERLAVQFMCAAQFIWFDELVPLGEHELALMRHELMQGIMNCSRGLH